MTASDLMASAFLPPVLLDLQTEAPGVRVNVVASGRQIAPVYLYLAVKALLQWGANLMRSDECTKLIDELLDGLICQADLQRLEAELESSAESRQAYYERQRLHTILQSEAETHLEPPTITRPSVWSEHRRWIIGIAVAASLLLPSRRPAR